MIGTVLTIESVRVGGRLFCIAFQQATFGPSRTCDDRMPGIPQATVSLNCSRIRLFFNGRSPALVRDGHNRTVASLTP